MSRLSAPAKTGRALSLAYLSSSQCTPAQAIQVAASQGYGWVGLRLLPNAAGAPQQYLIGQPQALREAVAAQRDTGVGVFDLEIIRIGADFDARHYLPLLEAGAALAAQAILVAGDDSDEARLTAGYAALCDLMAPYGMTADLEFMPWTAVPDARSALRIVRAAGNPANAGILVDALHFGRSRTTLDDIRAIPRSLLHYAQICDASTEAQHGRPFTTEELIHTARCERLLPGEGGIDLTGLFSALPRDLPISVEVIHQSRMAQTTPEAWARTCLDASRPYLGLGF